MEASRTDIAEFPRHRARWQQRTRVLLANRYALGRLLLLAAIGIIAAAMIFGYRGNVVLALTIIALLAVLFLGHSHRPPADPPNRRNTLDLLQTFLTTLVAKPDDADPFMVLLREIQSQMGATEGVIFVVQDTGEQILPLASTPGSDVESLASLLVSDWQGPNQENPVLRHARPNGHDGSQLVSVRLSDNTQAGRGFLLLRMPRALSGEEAFFLENLGEGLAGILCSVQAAQANERRALYEERGVIARELHDSLAQSLSYLKIQVARLQALLEPGKASQRVTYGDVDAVVQELRTNLNLAYQQLREVITTFRLTTDGRSFNQAIEDSVEEFEKQSSIVFRLDNRISSGDLTVAQEMHVLHIVREALSNVVRHSQAMCAEISLRAASNGKFDLAVDDDGVGIDNVRQRDRHHGLVIMQQRARSLGGDFRALPSQLGGTRVEVAFTKPGMQGGQET